jgi:hypothetical protein
LRQHLTFRTPGQLLARAYAANGRAHADQAAALLLSDTAWLELRWSDSERSITRELLAAITPHCSEDDYRALETHVLAYYPERAWRGAAQLGLAQLELIPDFCESRRSQALTCRLGELQRKFGRSDAEPPHGITVGVVGPPVQAKWDALGDENWLGLIEKHDSDDRVTRVDPLAGGARELARPLEESVKREPERFARLIRQFPDNTHPAYFHAVLRGIASTDSTDPELVWTAMRRCHALPDRPCGQSMNDVIRAYAGHDVPDDILELAAWYATKSPDPEAERGLDQADRENGLDNAGLNSVRGGMAWAFAGLLFKQPAYVHTLLPHLRIMVADPSVAVRSVVACTLTPVLNVDRDLAVELFLELCDTGHDVLLRSGFLFQFLHHACHTHRNELLAIIDRMLASSDERVAYQGAFLVVRFALMDANTLEDRAYRCVEGSVPMRRAAAEIAAANVTQAVHRDRCEAILGRLFDDPDKQVRQTAARCFRTLGDAHALGAHQDLLQNFFKSRSFPDESFTLFRAMIDSNEDIPERTCEAMERLMDKVRHAHAAGESIPAPLPLGADTLILRLYKRTRSPAMEKRCLDLIDDMLRFGIGGKLSSELDRER